MSAFPPSPRSGPSRPEISRRNLLALGAGAAPAPVIVALNTAGHSAQAAPVATEYERRFLDLYAKITDSANGFFSPDGIPYHSVETLIVENAAKPATYAREHDQPSQYPARLDPAVQARDTFQRGSQKSVRAYEELLETVPGSR